MVQERKVKLAFGPDHADAGGIVGIPGKHPSGHGNDPPPGGLPLGLILFNRTVSDRR